MGKIERLEVWMALAEPARGLRGTNRSLQLLGSIRYAGYILTGGRNYDELRNRMSRERCSRNDEAARQEELRYRQGRVRAATESAAKGHLDETNLRELLICTRDKNAASIAHAYFARHRQDSKLLETLLKIALEGEDAGDAPWAAANIIADYPASMLRPHRGDLNKLARERWKYLQIPARRALAKIAAVEDAK